MERHDPARAIRFLLASNAGLRYVSGDLGCEAVLIQVSLLASGSKGNALLIASCTQKILIDAGLSCREICKRLNALGVDPESLDALLVTHEHSDHVRGLGPLVRKFNLPVYLQTETASALKDCGRADAVVEFDFGSSFEVGDFLVRPFPITHDAVAPAGFSLECGDLKIGVATDLGVSTRLIAEHLKQCHLLVLESNHDEEMLRDGPYPWPLKQRVQGQYGHLSNRTSAALLQQLTWAGLNNVMLAHLSETNNRPELAVAEAERVLGHQSLCAPQLHVGSPTKPTALVEVTP